MPGRTPAGDNEMTNVYEMKTKCEYLLDQIYCYKQDELINKDWMVRVTLKCDQLKISAIFSELLLGEDSEEVTSIFDRMIEEVIADLAMVSSFQHFKQKVA